ncbi:hypothetical protein [Metamycoplasma equirhinis]|uniref:hypothetical protein n=1 Tax=Metamycoplasma equirhinis TaxID=92402 RepID=UPI003593D64F
MENTKLILDSPEKEDKKFWESLNKEYKHSRFYEEGNEIVSDSHPLAKTFFDELYNNINK